MSPDDSEQENEIYDPGQPHNVQELTPGSDSRSATPNAAEPIQSPSHSASGSPAPARQSRSRSPHSKSRSASPRSGGSRKLHKYNLTVLIANDKRFTNDKRQYIFYFVEYFIQRHLKGVYGFKKID